MRLFPTNRTHGVVTRSLCLCSDLAPILIPLPTSSLAVSSRLAGPQLPSTRPTYAPFPARLALCQRIAPASRITSFMPAPHRVREHEQAFANATSCTRECLPLAPSLHLPPPGTQARPSTSTTAPRLRLSPSAHLYSTAPALPPRPTVTSPRQFVDDGRESHKISGGARAGEPPLP